MGKARHNRNLGFNFGYVSESSMQNMADDLYHRTESYVKRPKEVHQKHHFDCQMKARRDRMSRRLVLWMETKTCPYCHKKRLCADFHYCPMCGKTLPH